MMIHRQVFTTFLHQGSSGLRALILLTHSAHVAVIAVIICHTPQGWFYRCCMCCCVCKYACVCVCVIGSEWMLELASTPLIVGRVGVCLLFFLILLFSMLNKQ